MILSELQEVNKGIVRNTQLDDVDYTDKRRRTSLVLDVETTIVMERDEQDKCPLPIFDIGYTISNVSREQMIIHRSYIIADIFLDMSIMQNVHYFNKYPQYVLGLAKGTIEMITFNDFIKILNEDIEKYNVKDMYAYNSKFDSAAIKGTNKFLNKLSELEYDIQCLWLASCQTYLKTQDFIQTAITNGWRSEKGNIKTSAEIAYRYISGNPDFVEAHTGLEDSIIETKILFHLKKFKKQAPTNQAPWKIVKDYAESLGYDLSPIEQPQEIVE